MKKMAGPEGDAKHGTSVMPTPRHFSLKEVLRRLHAPQQPEAEMKIYTCGPDGKNFPLSPEDQARIAMIQKHGSLRVLRATGGS